MDALHVHRNRRPPYPLDDRPGDLREIQPPGEVTGEAVEALDDRVAVALEEEAPRMTIPAAVAPAEALAGVDLAGGTPTGGTPAGETQAATQAMALTAATNRPTMIRVTTLDHMGMEVTLHPHDEQLPRRDTTGNSSMPLGGELKPRDHDLEPLGKGYRKCATTRFANAFTKRSRTRPTTSYGAHPPHQGRTHT